MTDGSESSDGFGKMKCFLSEEFAQGIRFTPGEAGFGRVRP
jgi:hypothetical protein